MAAQAVPGVGLLKGLGVTIKHMFKPAVTQQYPHVRPELPPRTRGVIALMDENCTVCMLCARECPDWCIYIDSHKETVPPAKEGGRARTRNVLDRFAIDFALCMYCGICVEVCPFDALFWSPEFEYSEYSIGALLHEKPKLREWMDTVPPPPALDHGADTPAEVADAIEKAQKELQAARAAEEEKAAAVAAPEAEAEGGAPAPTSKKKAEEPIEVEAGEIDQETFDKLIAEGKSERMARAKAKAAYVRKKKAEIRAEREAAGGDETPAEAATDEKEAPTVTSADASAPADAPSPDEAPEPKKAEIHVEAGEIDQETYDQLIAEGKSERIARSKAKAAYVRKKRKELSEEGGGE